MPLDCSVATPVRAPLPSAGQMLQQPTGPPAWPLPPIGAGRAQVQGPSIVSCMSKSRPARPPLRWDPRGSLQVDVASRRFHVEHELIKYLPTPSRCWFALAQVLSHSFHHGLVNTRLTHVQRAAQFVDRIGDGLSQLSALLDSSVCKSPGTIDHSSARSPRTIDHFVKVVTSSPGS